MSDLQATKQSPGTATILVVSDESAHAAQCKSGLKAAGFTVLTADGSSDALKICTQHEGAIDLLLTDLILPPPGFQLASSDNQFPHVNGFDLAVRASAIRQDLRIILMCKDRDKELAAHGISRTKIPILSKPLDQAGLSGFVQETLSQPPPSLEIAEQGKAANDTEWFG
ncbi:MAG: response regulator [Nitrospira sp.]|nr:response regulator [Nitrospira sp.]